MKIGVAAELTPEIIQKATKAGIQQLVFHKVHAAVALSELKNFQLHDSSKLSVEAKNYAYQSIEKRLAACIKFVPDLFYYRGYNLQLAIQKDLYWSLIIDNLNAYECTQIADKECQIFYLDYKQRKWFHYLKFFVKFFKKSRLDFYIDSELKVNQMLAVRMNSLSALNFFGNLLPTLGENNFFCFQSEPEFNDIKWQEQLHKKGIKTIFFRLKKKFSFRTNLRYFQFLFRNKIEFLNLLIDIHTKQINLVSCYESLGQKGVKGFLLNAGENEGEGVVAGLVAHQYGIRASNFMNGTKAKDPINQYTSFQTWFMHDEAMQRMLLSFSNQNKENMPVVGHLLMDNALAHQYSGTLDDWKNEMEHKKVIALFSSIIYNKERSDVAEFLVTFLESHPDVIVLVRRHPSEKQNLIYRHSRIFELPDFKEKSGHALFDLLLKSDVAISFGSTVSLQASWFGIPSITFEYNSQSLLLYVDQIKVHHTASIPDLALFLEAALTKEKHKRATRTNTQTVAQKMKEILLN